MKTRKSDVQIGKSLWYCCLIVLMVASNYTSIYAQCSQLVWSDEFNGTTLDLTKWSYQIGNGTNDALPVGWGNSELQYYTSRTQNVNVTGGNLEITAISESYLGANYTSGRIRSTNPITNNPQNEWQYGSFEARIKMPIPYNDSRAWPGFWMLPHTGPWPNTGEIDIVETGLNGSPWTYNGTIHYFSGAHQNTGTGAVTINTSPPCPAPNGDLSTCFHIYRMDWAPGTIKFFVDGIQIGATMSSGNTVGGVWPFDAANKFHILLNMAVGGWFPGTPVNNARFPLTMYVDYVRVYSNPSATQITGKTKVMQGDNGLTYSVTADAASTFNWSVPSGATITAGQGTNTITVNYGASAASGNVSCVITPSGGGCVAATVNLAVAVIANTCTVILENFEAGSPSTRNLGFNFSTGWMNRTCGTCQTFPYGTFANPGAVAPNTSANVGKYERNGGVQYDVVAYNDIAIGDASVYKTGLASFSMDVRTDAAAGTTVMVQLENRQRAQTGYPNGIYARYTAVTGAPNTWTTLNFTLLDTPDGTMPATQVDQIVLFFNPNSFTTNTYYFDNFKRIGTTPTTSAITGVTTACQNQAGVTYSVTGMAGSTYNWGVPVGATIVSGQGTNNIVVNFGTTSGTVTVIETSKINCAGPLKSLNVTVSGACVLTANFIANLTNTCIGNTIVFTNQSTGLTGGETYSWDFGAGASLPAGTTGVGPHNVTYSTAGLKTVSMTVTKGAANNTATKTNYITIAAAPTTCIMADDFNNGIVDWTPVAAPFTHTESGGIWTIANPSGHGEWDNFTYATNNGTVAGPLNFKCMTNKPILKIRAKASGQVLLRIQMMDATGLATDNVPGFNLELTTAWQTFTINYIGSLRNFYSATPGYLDSANISKLQFFINPGYVSYPYVGTNRTYNTAFTTGGTINVEWLGIGDNTCNDPLPVDLLSFTVKKSSGSSTLLEWVTASEKNNSHFEIQRSTDGKNFYTLNTVRGVGISSQLVSYSYIDEDLSAGTYYYRLNQVDIDGTGTYSAVAVINLEQWKGVEVQPTLLHAGERLLVYNYTSNAIDIYLTDLSGRIHAEHHQFSGDIKELNTAQLTAGVYMVRIVEGNQVVTKKVIVQ